MQNSDPRGMDTHDIEAAAVHQGRLSNPRLRLLTGVFAVITAASLAFGVTGFVQQRNDAQQSAQSTNRAATSLADQVLKACAGQGQQSNLLRRRGLCVQAADTKQQAKKSQTAAPQPVTRYVPIAGPRGFPGLPGPDGKTVVGPKGDSITGPQGDTVIGPQGKEGDVGADGPAGTAGKDSATVGPQGATGPGPTDAQVAAAVAAYCDTHNQCKGEQGPPGMDATLPPVPDPTPAP